MPRFGREFSMPNPETFSMPPVARLLDRWINGARCVVDPFARDSKRGTVTNDLNRNTTAEYHFPAEVFMSGLTASSADVVLFDPPYSPRQMSECYQQVGIKATTQDTQNARLYKLVKDEVERILRPGGIVICCGWNSIGMGIGRGYELLEILLVPHGAAHNDTIVTVERRDSETSAG